MSSLSYDNQADIIEAFNMTSLDHLLNIDNPCFKEWSTKFIHPI